MHLFDRRLQDVFNGKRVPEKWLIAFLAVVSCIGLMLTVVKIHGGIDEMCTTDECLLSADSIIRSINEDVEPCDDFYKFACGKWQYSHRLENDKPNNWFSERTRVISEAVTNILEEPDHDSDMKALKEARHFYRTCLDTDTINKLQYTLIFDMLEKVGLSDMFPTFFTVRDSDHKDFNLAKSLALIQRYLGIDVIVQLSLEVNPRTNRTIITIGPVTNIMTSLPDPLIEYHRNRVGSRQARHQFATPQDAETARIVKARINYMSAVISTLFPEEIFIDGYLQKMCFKIIVLEATLKRTLDLDTKPEESTVGRLRNYMMYSNTTIPFDEKLFDWQSYIDYFTTQSNYTWDMDDHVLVRNPEYFVELRDKLLTIPIEEIQQFIWWKVVESLIMHTHTDMLDLRFEFIRMIAPLSTKITRPEFCTAVTRAFAKGPIAYDFYVRDDMRVTTLKVEKMIKQLKEAFSTMIRESNWTDEATKQVTTLKANSMKIAVGYPEIFKYPNELEKIFLHINVKEGQYLKTMLDIRAREIGLSIGNVDQPIDVENMNSIVMDPLDVNAYYNRLENSINIPSGILQIPFFNKGVDVVNYGAIGSILGHEISHGFDIEGKDYDIHGQKTSQWSNNSVHEYLDRAKCFVEQYDKFKLNLNVKLNGTHTLAENMADNVGLKQSWKAYKSNNIGRESRLPGLTEYSNDQLFFLSYANVWCQNSEADKSDKNDVFNNNDHSPNVVRVLGALRNSPEFSDVWKCPVGSPMNPPKKCSMW